MQALEAIGVVEKDEEKGGRRITQSGQRDLDREFFSFFLGMILRGGGRGRRLVLGDGGVGSVGYGGGAFGVERLSADSCFLHHRYRADDARGVGRGGRRVK